jgi:hypothetical protein
VVGVDLEGDGVLRPFDRPAHPLAAGTAFKLPGRGSYMSRLQPRETASFSFIIEFDRSKAGAGNGEPSLAAGLTSLASAP